MKFSFDEYEELFPDRMSDDEFYSVAPSACMLVNALTANRAEAATGYKAERVKYAVFAVVNEMSAQNAARGDGGVRVVSVSNDSYTENYGALCSASNEENTLRSIAFRYLSGTGLVSAL